MLFNPLQQLKDIHLPQAIRFFPTAPGWIFLFTLMTIGLGYLLFYLFISSKRKQKRILLKKLQYTVDYLQNKPNKLIAELNLLMKQAALVVYPREKIVPLTGINWLNFLDKTGKTNQFSQGHAARHAKRSRHGP
ncbi:MAG: DUF4381 domain-containing protein [Pseudomonadota bacterium]